MAGLKDALEAEHENVNGPSCRVAALLDELDGEDAGVLREALENRAKQSSVISRALRAVGCEISPNILNRHRRGDCACDRRAA